MARRVLQFPVRNAFAPRTQDSLARDTQSQAQRIVQKVENEIARKAERLANDNTEELERARSYGVVMMPQTTHGGYFRKRLNALQASFGALAASLFSRPKPQ